VACGKHLSATACDERLGRVLGGDRGRAVVERARADVVAHGIVNPERWFATLAAGRY
jgi:hypothetical protein